MPIIIKNLETLSKQRELKDFEFKDLHLDFSIQSPSAIQLGQAVQNNDIQVDYDIKAIYNSLRSLLNTKPGERFLFPEYGLDLSTFLFEPVSEDLCLLIKNKIKTVVENFEPRVVLSSVIVIPDPDQQSYRITIVVELPIFKTKASLNAELSVKNQRFFILNS